MLNKMSQVKVSGFGIGEIDPACKVFIAEGVQFPLVVFGKKK
jgi:hypothetical protein